MEFAIESGIISGRGHIVYGINCQDSLLTTSFKHNGNTYHVGIVSDGCGEGKRSEVGAHLATSFLAKSIKKRIQDGENIKQLLATRLFWDLISYLIGIIRPYNGNPAEMVEFIKEHLLFTALGFVIGPKNTMVFAVGDGITAINGEIDLRDENNSPSYPAYHLIDKKHLKGKPAVIRPKFDVWVIRTEKLKSLVVGTDAWKVEVPILLEILKEGRDFNIQRKMNLLSAKERRFNDDASILVATRIA